MAIKKPLVWYGNQLAQLLDTDSVSGATVNTTGWTSLTLTSNWAGTAEFCVVGPVAFLNGVLNRSGRASSAETIFTLPAGVRPTRVMRFSVVDSNVPTVASAISKPYLEIAVNGIVSYGNYGSVPNPTQGLTLTDVFFPLL